MLKNNQVPKVINYFWFGKNELPASVEKCIKSWEKFCPDYKIKRWDESNFNVNSSDYIREAYFNKKWAFVSDYARIYILAKYGGLYFDTDVELIKPINKLVKKGPFINLEKVIGNNITPGMSSIAAVPNMPFFNDLLMEYNKRHFVMKDGQFDLQPIGYFAQKKLTKDGFKNKNIRQKVDGIFFYPSTYFSPINYNTGKLNITSDTYAIHHYQASWQSPHERNSEKIRQVFTRFLGNKIGKIAKHIYDLPLKIVNKL